MLNAQLGPYEIREEVGRGGMAAVYRAYQPTMERDVAIKVITKAIAGDDQAIQRFQREARLIARLEHPHILPVYDFDGGHEPPYIVMRYLDGGTLKEALSQNILPPAEISFLMRQVGSALDYAHRQGIVHRDIKPSNIMIDREGNAFVTDFGIARIASGKSEGQLTATGAIIGTPDYMSPEQAMAESEIDHRADIYALGVILFQMLTGQLPYQGDTTMGTLIMHIQNPIPSAIKYNGGLPPAMDDIIKQVLAKDPYERYNSAAELVQDITSALGGTISSTPAQLRQAAGSAVTLRKQTTLKNDTQTPSEQNKTVTVLNANAAEYAELVDELEGVEASRRAVNAFWHKAEKIVAEYGGQIFSQADNALMALWGANASREDDAERAIRAALDIRTALKKQSADILEEEESDEPLPLNIGLNTGLALIAPQGQSGEYSATGGTVSLTNRLMRRADGDILITHDTYNQVRGVFDFEPDTPLKGRGSRKDILIYRVVAAKARAFHVNTRGVEGIETEMIGRESELKVMQNAFLDIVEEDETQAITIIGEAGVGKSRLLYQFITWSDLRPERFWVYRGRATPEMTNRPYALLRDILSFRFEIHDNDTPAVMQNKLESGITTLIGEKDSNEETAHLLGHLAGFDFSASPYIKGLLGDPKQLNSRARVLFNRFMQDLCAINPLVFELEDIHHADNATLDLLTNFVTDHDDLPLLLICLARPSLYEHRPTWASGLSFHTRLDLRPLDKRENRRLVREILQKVNDVPRPLRDLLVERSEGNPYYLEELIKTLIDDRVIIKENDDSWRVESSRLDHLEVPSTLSGLLQTRLDSLLYPEKLTLQRAAVIGRVFYDSALKALDAADETHVDNLSTILKHLTEREFISVRETTGFEGNVEYIFRGAMVRDVILNSLLQRQKQSYNRSAAEWLINISGDRVEEYNGLIADYFEKAGDNIQAAEYLCRAGNKALGISAYTEAESLFTHALSLLPQSDPATLPFYLQLGQTQFNLGDYPGARDSLLASLALARQQNNPVQIAESLSQLSRISIEAEGDFEPGEAYLAEALPLARRGNNPDVLAQVLYGLGDLDWRTGKPAKAKTKLEESLALAKQVNNTNLELYALNRLGTVAFDLGDTNEGERLYQQTLKRAREIANREREATALNNLGVLAQERGDLEAAQVYGEQVLPIAREIGHQQMIALALSNLSEGYITLGNIPAAYQALIEGLTLSVKIGAVPMILICIQNAGFMALREGNIERGLALTGLSIYHPSAYGDGYRTAEQNFSALNYTITDPDIVAGMEAGKTLDLDTVVEELLTELKPAT